LAVENQLGRMPMSANFFTPKADYLLKVRGNSMVDVGILDGDLLAVHKTSEARSGQIVVARLGEEVTVKRLKRSGKRIELIAENPDFAPIVVDGPLEIEGIAVGLIRDGFPM
jgi:repressor LexA